ncbi:MAG: hypothetical protein Kow0047_01760 [Anaerolineae bacterium]
MQRRRRWAMIVIAVMLVTTLGCSVTGLIARTQPTPTPTRTPRPTFTPTPAPPDINEPQTESQTAAGEQAAQPTPTPEPPTPTPEPPTPTPIPTPFLTVSGDTVNLRSGPGTNYARVGQAQAGQRFDITGKNPAGDWWEICCVGGKTAWIFGQLTRPEGPIDTVPVSERIPPPPPTPRPRPTTPPPPTPTPAPQYAFNASFVEPRPSTNPWVTIWGRVFNAAKTEAYGGYKVRVLRGGSVVAEAVTGNQVLRGDPGLPSEFIYNAKIEIQNYSDGQYTVQLLDAGGQPAGPDQVVTVSGELRVFLVEWIKR